MWNTSIVSVPTGRVVTTTGIPHLMILCTEDILLYQNYCIELINLLVLHHRVVFTRMKLDLTLLLSKDQNCIQKYNFGLFECNRINVKSTPSCFITIFTKGNDFCDILFHRPQSHFKMGSTMKGKNLLLWEQILSFKSLSLLRRELKTKMVELLPLKVYPLP